MAVAAMQGADQLIRSSFWVWYLAQGHFDMQTRGTEPATFGCCLYFWYPYLQFEQGLMQFPISSSDSAFLNSQPVNDLKWPHRCWKTKTTSLEVTL